jgi:hypothetical protein
MEGVGSGSIDDSKRNLGPTKKVNRKEMLFLFMKCSKIHLCYVPIKIVSRGPLTQLPQI